VYFSKSGFVYKELIGYAMRNYLFLFYISIWENIIMKFLVSEFLVF